MNALEMLEMEAGLADESASEQPDKYLALCEDAAEIVTRDLPPLVPIVDNLLCPEAKLLIGSGSKSYKTWLTMHLAFSIAHGTEFLGWQCKRRRVLYVNLELRPVAFQRRMQTLADNLGYPIEPESLIHLPMRGRMNTELDKNIEAILSVAKAKRAEVVVLDPVYKLNSEGEENSSRDMTRLFNAIDRLTTEAGCAVILNDHFSKGSQAEKDPLDAIRGSSAKGGDVDAAMILRRLDMEDHFRVDIIHRELPPVDPFSIAWSFPMMELAPEVDADKLKKPGGRKRKFSDQDLLAEMRETTATAPISVSHLADRIEGGRSTVSERLTSLRKRGLVKTVGEGNTARQFISEAGLIWLEKVAP